MSDLSSEDNRRDMQHRITAVVTNFASSSSRVWKLRKGGTLPTKQIRATLPTTMCGAEGEQAASAFSALA
jgi:hypothetical protein